MPNQLDAVHLTLVAVWPVREQWQPALLQLHTNAAIRGAAAVLQVHTDTDGCGGGAYPMHRSLILVSLSLGVI